MPFSVFMNLFYLVKFILLASSMHQFHHFEELSPLIRWFCLQHSWVALEYFAYKTFCKEPIIKPWLNEMNRRRKSLKNRM